MQFTPTHARTSVSLVALSLSVALATSAFADETAPSDSRLNDPIIVTASRSGDGVPASQLAASVTVLDSDALTNRQTRNVSDILRDVPGVAVSRAGAPGGLTQVRLRGSEANHVLVLIDGIEASDPYLGEFDFATLIADPEARIEVLRGQQSSLYGSDAIGGVIHYITPTGAEAPGVRAYAEGGSFGTVNGALRAAGVTGALDYSASAAYRRERGYATAVNGVRDVGSKDLALSGRLIWEPADTLRFTATARYNDLTADTNDTEYDPASANFGRAIDTPGVYTTAKTFYGLVEGRFAALDGRWITTLGGQIATSRRKGFQPFGLDYGSRGWRYKGTAQSSLHLGDDRVAHRITAALDLEREKFQNITPYPGVFQGKRHTNNVGIVGEYELNVAKTFTFGASVRRDENNRFDDTTTWRVQASYLLPTHTRVHGAYGTGVKNPGFYDLYGYNDGQFIGNANLKPEKSEGWEAGIEQGFGKGQWATLGVTWFDSRLKDEIFITYPAPDYVATPDNRTTRSHQKGLEVFASARPLPQLRFDLAYTYLKAREDGTREVRRPKHIASFNTTVSSRDERFSGTLTIRYNGRQDDLAYTDPSYIPITVQLKEYVLVNLSAQYQLTPAITVFGRVENLIDEHYQEVFSYRGAPRAAYAGLRASF